MPAPRPRPATGADTLVSTTILDGALRCLVGQVRVDRRHDVPYLAGSSRDGRTVYIDRHLPKHFRSRGRLVGGDAFLVLHEVVEKLMFDRFRMTYPHAHQFALRLEQVAVRNAGISWHDYNAFMDEHVKEAHDERLRKLPRDLELQPYRDERELALVEAKRPRRRRGARP